MIRDVRSDSGSGDPPTAIAFARVRTSGHRPGRGRRARQRDADRSCAHDRRDIAAQHHLQARIRVDVSRPHLAARVVPEHSSVCVIDTDLESRDVGVRFDVTTPTLLDVANAVTLRDSSVQVADVIPRIDPPGVHVLPTRLPQSALVPLLHNKTTALLPHLRAAFDFVVIDAPVTVGPRAVRLGAHDVAPGRRPARGRDGRSVVARRPTALPQRDRGARRTTVRCPRRSTPTWC